MDNHKGPARFDRSEPAGDTGQEVSVWRFAPLADYRPPFPPVSSAAGRTWSSLTRLFGGSGDKAQSPAVDRDQLLALAPEKLKRLSPSPDWAAAAQVLDHALGDWWRQDDPEQPVRFLVGPPYSGQAEMVRHWGAAHGAAVVTEPSGEQILAADADWLDHWPESAPLWVLPHLEWCFLRHADGLSLVRELFDRAQSGCLGRGLIGCDSWAWAFLEHVWPVRRPEAFSVQAVDGDRLARLLATLATPRPGARIRFRNAQSGDDLLAAPFAEADRVRSEIAQLAAHCRGNAGLAASLWRRRLCAAPEGGEAAAAATAGDNPTEVIYVAENIPEVRPAAHCGEEDVLLLHALLLHNGLAEPLLTDLLPLPASRTAAGLRRLQQAGLAERYDGRWRVAAPACVPVRDLLASRDYLCDAF